MVGSTKIDANNWMIIPREWKHHETMICQEKKHITDAIASYVDGLELLPSISAGTQKGVVKNINYGFSDVDTPNLEATFSQIREETSDNDFWKYYGLINWKPYVCDRRTWVGDAYRLLATFGNEQQSFIVWKYLSYKYYPDYENEEASPGYMQHWDSIIGGKEPYGSVTSF